MSITKSVRWCAIGLMFCGLIPQPTVAAARDPQIAGYCWVDELTSRGKVVYNSSTFQKDSAYFDRDGWAADFKEHMRKAGVDVQYSGCRLWKGGADAVDSANEAKAIKHTDFADLINVSWAPEGTFGDSTGRSPHASTIGREVTAKAGAEGEQVTQPNREAIASSRYVEVAGPDGPIRLSPEVAARNKAAADEYRRKMVEHANATANHERKLALHQQSIASAAAEKREHERRIAANAAEVAAYQAALLEHRKLSAKPAGVNAVYRGFGGPTCEIARRSAVSGSGTGKGTQFVEVTQDLSGMPRTCVVQGWWWNTSRTGSSRQ